MSNDKYTKPIAIIQGMNFCQGCTTAVSKGLNSCKECDNFIAKQLAIDALKAQQERDNPQPLTLEQLKERVGKPIWIVMANNKFLTNRWEICEVDMDSAVQGGNKLFYQKKHYGKTWLAYDYEPTGACE